jgi:hypothetical protein
MVALAFTAVTSTVAVCIVVIRLVFQGPSRPRKRQRRR